MQKLGLMDSMFLLSESRETPMHVGGLHLLTIPDDVDEVDFLQDIGELLVEDPVLAFPFGQRLKPPRIPGVAATSWEDDPRLDMDYHVRHSALPRPGRYRELFALVSRLHSTLLDRSRPLWEFHLIEGLENRQFAHYLKVHHAAMDGARGMHLTNSMYSTNPGEPAECPFSLQTSERYDRKLAQRRRTGAAPAATSDEIKTLNGVFSETFGTAVNLTRAVGQALNVFAGFNDRLHMPYHRIPKTPLNRRVSAARRFVAQSWSFERMYAVGKALGGTLNDTTLAMCAGALRKYLQLHAELPEESMKAMAPISLRKEGDARSSNAVSAVTADLATNVADVEERYKIIRASMLEGRKLMQQMTKREVELFTMLISSPAPLLALLGIEDKFPAYSTVISNVPGPRQQMYWNGARLDGIYPVSVVTHGIALNITLVSNNDRVDFGITACLESMPMVQRLIDYLEDALVELEQLAGITVKPRKARKKTRKQSARRSKKR